jgi:hypothetical protein
LENERPTSCFLKLVAIKAQISLCNCHWASVKPTKFPSSIEKKRSNNRITPCRTFLTEKGESAWPRGRRPLGQARAWALVVPLDRCARAGENKRGTGIEGQAWQEHSRRCQRGKKSKGPLISKISISEANRRRGPGTREKVSLRRINLEGNTHSQESNASQLPV